jgi:hypothetical protein
MPRISSYESWNAGTVNPPALAQAVPPEAMNKGDRSSRTQLGSSSLWLSRQGLKGGWNWTSSNVSVPAVSKQCLFEPEKSAPAERIA